MTDARSNIEKVGAEKDRPAPKAAARRRAPAKRIPDGAKKPEDHRSAKEDVVAPDKVTVEWKTKPGEPDEDGNPGERIPATYDIDILVFDDIDFVESMIALDDSNSDSERSVYAFKALRQLLGPEQFAQYKENIRDPETGRASFSDTVPFFNHIVREVKQGNS